MILEKFLIPKMSRLLCFHLRQRRPPRKSEEEAVVDEQCMMDTAPFLDTFLDPIFYVVVQLHEKVDGGNSNRVESGLLACSSTTIKSQVYISSRVCISFQVHISFYSTLIADSLHSTKACGQH